MSVSQLVDLRGVASWDLPELLISSFQWDTDLPLAQLNDVTVRLSPHDSVEVGTPTISPSGIDNQYGGVRRRSTKFQGGGYIVGGNVDNIRPGDVLIPKAAGIPGVFITESLLGSVFSDGFLAFRTIDSRYSLWLWAVLSSTKGLALRRFMASGGMRNIVMSLDGVALPWPPQSLDQELCGTLLRIHERVEELEEEQAVSTWWASVDLQNHEWRLALASPDPNTLTGGEPLGKHAAIIAGRPVKTDIAGTTEEGGLLPVMTGSVLSGRARPRWCSAEHDTVVALPGDVVVSALGPRANARVCDREAIIDSGAYIVRLGDRGMAPNIAAYLNSQRGYAHRQVLTYGGAAPWITSKDLGKMPLPADVFSKQLHVGPLYPLAEELDGALWKN